MFSQSEMIYLFWDGFLDFLYTCIILSGNVDWMGIDNSVKDLTTYSAGGKIA